MKPNELSFSKKSRRAILLFVSVFVVITLIPRIVYLLREPSDFSFTQTEFERKIFRSGTFEQVRRDDRRSDDRGKRYSAPSQRFDPNTYVASDWMKLGLSQKQAEVILKFGKRGFYSNDDLKRVFVISDELFTLIKDSTFYPERPQRTFVSEPSTAEQRKRIIVSINDATEEELLKIPGVGSFFAKFILKRRDELGGFAHKDQLLEVWKMTPEKLEELKPYFSVDPSQIRKFNLNSVQVEELKKHPYISWNVANSIVKLRAQKGGTFHAVEDIQKSVLIDAELFAKLKPYITVE